MEFIDYIKTELLILIPVLYLIGIGLKRTKTLQDKHIPLLLGLISIVLALLYTFAHSETTDLRACFMAVFVGITQGILCAGTSVYFNQLYKQEKGK